MAAVRVTLELLVFRELTYAIAVTLMAVSASAGVAAELPNHTSKAPLPELYVFEIANPFPTLYVVNAEGRLVLQGKGKEAPAFEFDFKKLADRPLRQTESVEKVEKYLDRYNDSAKTRAPNAEYYSYFFTLDPDSFGGRQCEPCLALESKLIQNIEDSGHQVYLEVVLVTNP